jgi:hypothetical protein
MDLNKITPFIGECNYHNYVTYYKSKKIININFYDNVSGDVILNLNKANFIYNIDNIRNVNLKVFYPKCEVKNFSGYLYHFNGTLKNIEFFKDKKIIFIGKTDIFRKYTQMFIPIQVYEPKLIKTDIIPQKSFNYIIKKTYEISLIGSYSKMYNINNLKEKKIKFDVFSGEMLNEKGKKYEKLNEIIKNQGINAYGLSIEYYDYIIKGLHNKEFRQIFNELIRDIKIKDIL